MDKKIYIKNIVEDKSQMMSLANMAKQDSHNFLNFEKRIDNYLSYHLRPKNSKNFRNWVK